MTPWKARPHGRFEKLEKFCGSRDGLAAIKSGVKMGNLNELPLQRIL
jgi:hypothetical protein